MTGGWQDMSTAPRDGTAIVGQYSGPEHYGDDCGFKHFEVTVRWGQGLGFGAWVNETGGLVPDPDRWRPLGCGS